MPTNKPKVPALLVPAPQLARVVSPDPDLVFADTPWRENWLNPCLLELIGAVLLERGDITLAEVRALLANVSPDALWERMAELIDAVQYGELDRE